MGDQTKLLQQELSFVNGLLALDGYNPYLRELLSEAKREIEEELARSIVPGDAEEAA